MSFLTRNVILLALISGCAGLHSLSYSQTQTAKKTLTATVSGRVTVGGKGRGGVALGLWQNSNSSVARAASRNAITDVDGNYRITGVLPGSYYVAPMTALFVSEDPNPASQMGKPLLVSEGESVDDINFAMMRGSVITGKVTDPDGRPVIEEPITAMAVDPQTFYAGRSSFETDDRGIYRIFGLRAGRYRVAAGVSDRGSSVGRSGYQPGFYPNATNADQAKIVELAEGEQATNIDITMSRGQPGFAASGIIVNGETNNPLANVRVALQKMNDDRSSFTQAGTVSNQKGEFRLENIPPGKYSVLLMAQGDNELRADYLEFQLSDQDVSGLVVRTTRGASISGFVQVEGTNDPAILAKVRQLRIFAWVQGGRGGGARPSLVAADGGFRISPLPAGIVNFEFAAMNYGQETGLILSRIERDGVAVPRGSFDIKAGEQVSGVRLVLSYGSGSVRGIVNFENGPPAPGTRFLVRLSKPGDNDARLPQKEADARGRFMIEGVPPGAYDLSVIAVNSSSRERASSATQSITVADNATTEVVISLDLARRQ